MANEKLKRQNLERALEAAYQCFLEVGIEKTTQTMVAERSGVSLRSVSRYFIDKADLAIQVAEYVDIKVAASISEEVVSLPKDGKTGVMLLRDYMKRVERQALEHPEGYALRQEYLLFALRNHLPYEELKERLSCGFGNHPVLDEIFRIGRADGTIKTPLTDEEETAYFMQAFMTTVANQAVRYWAGGERDAHKDFLDEYIDRVICGYPKSRYA
jgi:AcrR family transcriptional regulator